MQVEPWDFFFENSVTVSAILFVFAKIGDFAAQGWNFRKMYVHTC